MAAMSHVVWVAVDDDNLDNSTYLIEHSDFSWQMHRETDLWKDARVREQPLLLVLVECTTDPPSLQFTAMLRSHFAPVIATTTPDLATTFGIAHNVFDIGSCGTSVADSDSAGDTAFGCEHIDVVANQHFDAANQYLDADTQNQAKELDAWCLDYITPTSGDDCSAIATDSGSDTTSLTLHTEEPQTPKHQIWPPATPVGDGVFKSAVDVNVMTPEWT
ncbi:hypothetical protein BAUCODRAFT_331595 [Baudoinia panamericana UAMH 10762]|uniref:Uncharacterized protein n=1 Tax=Baudoinia panamericana (strain UAMH 10762) TaxID=717646 RepID=M2MI33_BAUPA|nr:uncharacterized protein BAUCODRAFT_331595 [Baudoinia panamericana UAMH 10762]EMC90923.1 hypothetical protein BAUCODRAFT_331595 [Baudoinia panamericana UAMH 10762]